jgi:hypothetical protein
VPLFYLVFGMYTTAAVFLLLLGLGSALAGLSTPILEVFQDAAHSAVPLAPVWQGVVQSAPLSEAPGLLLLDYLLSGLNLTLGVFLIWRRPLDSVARLLGLAMVGTAAAFNLQAHTAFAMVDAVAPQLHAIIPIHWVLHAVSGAAYLHALLVFPNGRVVPPRLVWLVRLAYLFMLEEIALSFVTGSVGLVAVPFQLLFGFRGSTPEVLGKLMDSDALFVVIFFGVLLPLPGVTSQVYHSVAISDLTERERTRLVVWALTVAFGVGAAVLLFGIVLTLTHGVSFSEHLLGETNFAAFRVLPLLFGLIPAALFLAIIRDRLFDLDVVIGRTLVYGLLTPVLAVVFFTIVFVLQHVPRCVIGGPNEFALAVAALVNGLLFQPMRRRMQRVLDRRIRTPKIDANRPLADFRNALRTQQLDVDCLRERVLSVTGDVLHPARVELWLRDRELD